MHPESDRYTKAKFDVYFRSRMDSKGALLVSDGKSGEVIGSSRFSEYNTLTGTVEIGGTFLKCSRWGTGANRELKTLMLAFAFGNVDQVEFLVGIHNFRSQAAMTKIGGKIIRTITEDEPEFVYAITKSEFLDGQLIER
jgi:N-acetyltransferase